MTTSDYHLPAGVTLRDQTPTTLPAGHVAFLLEIRGNRPRWIWAIAKTAARTPAGVYRLGTRILNAVNDACSIEEWAP